MRLIDADIICFDALKDDFDRARAEIIINGQPTVNFATEKINIQLPFKVGDVIYVPWKNRSKFSSKRYTDIMQLRISGIGSTTDNPEWFVLTGYCRFKVSEYGERFFSSYNEAKKIVDEG